MTMAETARLFFDACETGQGWAGCSQYCAPEAGFAAQAEPLAKVTTLEAYTDWMKGLLVTLPDGHYEVKSFAVDEARSNVCAYGVFAGAHTGPGGPMPPTGKATQTDYVYVMQFADGKVAHMTKIWNANWAVKQLGWA